MVGLKGVARPALVAVAVLAGCGGNVTVSRGFGSREVLPLRDSTISLVDVIDVAGQNPCLDYHTRDDDGAVTAWSLDLVTGELLNQCSAPSSGPPPSTGRYSCQTAAPASDGTSTLQITDLTTGAETDVDGVVTYAGCPGEDGVLSIFRLEPNGNGLILWSGPYQQLAVVAAPIRIQSVVRFRASTAGSPDAGAPVTPDVVVAGSVPGQPEAVGIYTIDVGSGAATNIVPATPASAAWAQGAPVAGSLESATISQGLGIYRFNGHYIYGRTMSDGGTTLFAGPFGAGPASELALFQVSPGELGNRLGLGLRVSPPDDSVGAVIVPAIASWELDDPSGASSQLMVWDDTDTRMAVCPSSFGAFQAGVLSPDGTHVLFRQASGATLTSLGPLQLLTLGTGGSLTCLELADRSVFWAQTSGDGTKIAWIVQTNASTLDGQLWTANADGTGAQMVFEGAFYNASFIPGTTKLEILYGGDLVWLDVQDPTQLVYVAEEVFGGPTLVSGSWFVEGYNYSTQDGSGTLGAINLETGKKLPISPAVNSFVVAAQAVPSSDDMLSGAPQFTGVYHVVYLVRGRNPSAQDGIWVATIEPADLP